ncbi:hypothetical protein M768_19660 [Cellulosimicrobium cellulans F16]|uniref:Protein-glutamine gamma-glutamyltransferase-like C-terminal domain-containing protein n=1 Tax=Cellulosimicrobium cellulans F16 TaxID=1350482 RepID=A0A0M0F6I5_CELCE|nr:DUF4129 domain-containing protein [Cellulosimicrobium cellulans]KON72811.1 hypothetical protein M768_19660 [Cellulosimicrobium cellulans F16]
MTAPQGDDHRRPGPARFAAVAALALAAVLAAAVGAPWGWEAPGWFDRVGQEQVAPPPETATTDVLSDARDQIRSQTDSGGLSVDAFILWTLGIVALVLLVVLARRYLPALLVRRRRRELLGTAPGDVSVHVAEDPVVPELQEAVDRAHDDLHVPDVDPHDAVVAAWVALERAAERAGTRRDPAQTPTEFTSAVLASTRVDADAVATLRGLYHRARFGETPLGARDLEAARAALARIAADLATHPGRPTVAASDAAVPHDHPLHDEARP